MSTDSLSSNRSLSPNINLFGDEDEIGEVVEVYPPSTYPSGGVSSLYPPKTDMSTLLSHYKETRGAGRPTKLTQDRCDQIISAIRSGVPVETAVSVSGVESRSFYNWMKTGYNHSLEKKNSIFFQFFLGVLIARDELEAELASKWKKITTEGLKRHTQVWKEKIVEKPVTLPDGTQTIEIETVRYLASETIDITGDGDWRGIAEFMARRYPNWRKIETIEQTGKDGGPIQIETATIDPEKMSPEARRVLLEEVQGRMKVIGAGTTERDGEGITQETDNREDGE